MAFFDFVGGEAPILLPPPSTELSERDKVLIARAAKGASPEENRIEYCDTFAPACSRTYHSWTDDSHSFHRGTLAGGPALLRGAGGVSVLDEALCVCGARVLPNAKGGLFRSTSSPRGTFASVIKASFLPRNRSKASEVAVSESGTKIKKERSGGILGGKPAREKQRCPDHNVLPLLRPRPRLALLRPRRAISLGEHTVLCGSLLHQAHQASSWCKRSRDGSLVETAAPKIPRDQTPMQHLPVHREAQAEELLIIGWDRRIFVQGGTVGKVLVCLKKGVDWEALYGKRKQGFRFGELLAFFHPKWRAPL